MIGGTDKLKEFAQTVNIYPRPMDAEANYNAERQVTQYFLLYEVLRIVKKYLA